jgi:hypothetical protein
MRLQKTKSSFVLCVRDDGAEDLEERKLYQVLPDRAAARDGYLRVVDESGEDYLYPSDLFVPVRLPAAIARRLMSSSQPTQAVGRRGSTKPRLRMAR